MQQEVRKKPFSLANILAFLLGIAMLAALLTQVNLRELADSLLKVDAGMFGLGALAYLVKSFIRALRFWRFERADGQPVSFWHMARLTFASTLASQVLPLKLGELTYVYLIRTDIGGSIARGISGLMMVRVFDILAIALLFLATAGVVGLPGTLSRYFTSILLLTVVLAVAVGGMLLAGRLKLPSPAFVERRPLLRKARAALAQVLETLHQHIRRIPEMTGLALAEWLANFAMYHALLVGLGLAPQFLHTVTAVTLAAVASLLPINSFGNFGTQEAGWATGLILLGYTRSAAIASGFATHLLVMVYVTVQGAASWLSYLVKRR